MAILGFASRFSACLLILGFLLIPPLPIFHFFGFRIAAGLLFVELVVCVILVSRSLHRQQLNFKEMLCTPIQAHFNINPLLLCALCAALFLAPGIWIILSSGAPESDNPDAMTAGEQIWFGTIFCLLGAGVCGVSAAQWLTDRGK